MTSSDDDVLPDEAPPRSRLIGDLREKVRVEIERIEATQGMRISAEDYVRCAASTTSPLHPTLEWDDSAAAHHHRVHQARFIIRKIKVERVGGGTTAVHLNGRVSTVDHQGHHAYGGVRETLRDRGRASQVILDQDIARGFGPFITKLGGHLSIYTQDHGVDDLADEAIRKAFALIREHLSGLPGYSGFIDVEYERLNPPLRATA